MRVEVETRLQRALHFEWMNSDLLKDEEDDTVKMKKTTQEQDQVALNIYFTYFPGQLNFLGC